MMNDDPWTRVQPTQDVSGLGKPVSSRRRFLRRFLREHAAVVALGFLLFMTVIAIIGPWITPFDPLKQDLRNVLQPSSRSHLLGTDQLGRDVFSRLIVATRVSMQAATMATLITLMIGVPLGLASGFFGGWSDRGLMLVNDSVMALPALVLAIAIIGVLGPGLNNAMVAVGVVASPRILRLVRGSVLGVKEETFIEASHAIGTSSARILRKHVLPNVVSPLIVASSLFAGRAMLIEAGLSFIGLGVQPPEASWGAMLGMSFRYTSKAPAMIFYPGIAIAVTVLAFNVFGDGIRDSLGREVRRS